MRQKFQLQTYGAENTLTSVTQGKELHSVDSFLFVLNSSALCLEVCANKWLIDRRLFFVQAKHLSERYDATTATSDGNYPEPFRSVHRKGSALHDALDTLATLHCDLYTLSPMDFVFQGLDEVRGLLKYSS